MTSQLQRIITFEELELERVNNLKGEVYCPKGKEKNCEHSMEFSRCAMDTYYNCPHYRSERK